MAASTSLLKTSAMPNSSSADHLHSSYPLSACPSCGHGLPISASAENDAVIEARRRVVELEAQIKHLNSRAATSADKLADYEDELRYLREAHAKYQQQVQLNNSPRDGFSATTPPQQQAPSQPPQPSLSRLASLSSLLPGRRKEVNAANAANAANAPSTPATQTFPQNYSTLSPPKTPFYNGNPNKSAPHLQSSHSDTQILTLNSLQSSLDEERSLRLRAESSLTQTQTELEELTAQLFGQANEMVAAERKARAKLEERVKILEQRDTDKRKRLDRLEKAIARIERVRGMVGPT
ncbi:hypothetical protein B0A52_05400 [Exophiala mesophila]|uniref:GDP/GTP exchange factor Sec2 N-terminal domain-containing protein n=1 Tax=Exophiala mesophila TaxID=212818 RepID=A0A438N4U4_EXOME|nr:hypothetical protein B0A52_05400 [Exophiala mesophila]